MKIRGRKMGPSDIDACVEIVAAHPIIGPRYGAKLLGALGKAWFCLLEKEAFLGRVFEERHGSRLRIVAVGTRFFISDKFLDEIKRPPHRWIAPELVRRIGSTDCPVLTDKQVRAANVAEGLNLLVLEGAVCASDMGRPEVIGAFFEEFVALHRGFRLKELITQGTSTDVMDAQLHSGGYLLDRHGCYTRGPHTPAEEILKRPHFIGVSRELALKQFGVTCSSMTHHG